MGLLAWSYHGWASLQERAHEADTLLTTAHTNRARCLAGRAEAGGPGDIRNEAALAPCKQRSNRCTWAQLGRAQDAPGPRQTVALGHLGLLQNNGCCTTAGHYTRRSAASLLGQVEQAVRRRPLNGLATSSKPPTTSITPGTLIQCRVDRGACRSCCCWLMARAPTACASSRIKTLRRGKSSCRPVRRFCLIWPSCWTASHYLDILATIWPCWDATRRPAGTPADRLFSKEKGPLFMRVLRYTLDTRETSNWPTRAHHGGIRHIDSRCAPVGDSDRWCG